MGRQNKENKKLNNEDKAVAKESPEIVTTAAAQHIISAPEQKLASPHDRSSSTTTRRVDAKNATTGPQLTSESGVTIPEIAITGPGSVEAAVNDMTRPVDDDPGALSVTRAVAEAKTTGKQQRFSVMSQFSLLSENEFGINSYIDPASMVRRFIISKFFTNLIFRRHSHGGCAAAFRTRRMLVL